MTVENRENKKQKPSKFCRKIRNVIKPLNKGGFIVSHTLPWDPSLLTNEDCVYPNFCVSFTHGGASPGGPMPPQFQRPSAPTKQKSKLKSRLSEVALVGAGAYAGYTLGKLKDKFSAKMAFRGSKAIETGKILPSGS